MSIWFKSSIVFFYIDRPGLYAILLHCITAPSYAGALTLASLTLENSPKTKTDNKVIR